MFAARAITSLSIHKLPTLASGICVMAIAALAVALPAEAQEGPQPTTATVLVYHSTDSEGDAPNPANPPGCEAIAGSNPVVIDFEGFSDGQNLNGVDLGGVTATAASGTVEVYKGNRAGASFQSPDTSVSSQSGSIGDPITFTFDSLQDGVTLAAGDAGEDIDRWKLEAFDSVGGLIDSVEENDSSWTGNPYRTLEVSGSGIKTVVASFTGAAAGIAYDDLTFDGGGGLDCAITGSQDDVIELWVDGGSDNGDGNHCQMSPGGNTGDYVCGADILLEITDGSGRFTEIRPFESTLVHNPECSEPGEGYCDLPSEPATTQLRMNFRRGEGERLLGPRHIANLRLNTVGSTVQSPMVVKMRNFIAAGASLQERMLVTLGSGEGDGQIVARGPVPAPEPGQFMLLASGLAGLVGLDRLRRRREDP
ncbi:MAG: hypothetical protein JRG96_00225 [Deltaproteobacteria bacterium]|nr:hypothetical protein [Deltaproteobacteria bacterium]